MAKKTCTGRVTTGYIRGVKILSDLYCPKGSELKVLIPGKKKISVKVVGPIRRDLKKRTFYVKAKFPDGKERTVSVPMAVSTRGKFVWRIRNPKKK